MLALGSVTNFYSVAGAAQHALTLETVDQAEAFRRSMLSKLIRNGRVQQSTEDQRRDVSVNVTVIGGGATGVELAAALRGTAEMMRDYHLPSLNPDKHIHVRLLEGSDRLLPALPEKISQRARDTLEALGVEVRLDCKVLAVDHGSVSCNEGDMQSDITIWAAGIKGPPALSELQSLPLNRLGQVIVSSSLKVHPGEAVYALGDCAQCIGTQGAIVPPRAQAAYQQAVYLSDAIERSFKGLPVSVFKYRDQGTLISFGRAGASGALMTTLLRRPLFVNGWFASSCYRYLYHRHIAALTGIKRAAMYVVSQWLRERVRPTVKLH